MGVRGLLVGLLAVLLASVVVVGVSPGVGVSPAGAAVRPSYAVTFGEGSGVPGFASVVALFDLGAGAMVYEYAEFSSVAERDALVASEVASGRVLLGVHYDGSFSLAVTAPTCLGEIEFPSGSFWYQNMKFTEPGCGSVAHWSQYGTGLPPDDGVAGVRELFDSPGRDGLGELLRGSVAGVVYGPAFDVEPVDPCEGLSLAECYAPEVRFHPLENFFPMDPNDFIAGSELNWVSDGCRDTRVEKDPDPRRLGSGDYAQAEQARQFPRPWCTSVDRAYPSDEYTRPYKGDPSNGDRAIDSNDDFLNDGEGFTLAWKDYSFFGNDPVGLNNEPAGTAINVSMFAQQFPPTDEETNPLVKSVLVYHMFYGYDPKANKYEGNNGVPAAVDGIVAHEGDWERLYVALNANDTPVEVRYGGHGCEPETIADTHYVAWGDFSDDSTPVTIPGRGNRVGGTHPVVYVAEGSHASYPNIHSPGDAMCGSGATASGKADITEYDPGTSKVWRPWAIPGGVADPAKQCWYGYGGAWGRGGNLPPFVFGGTDIRNVSIADCRFVDGTCLTT